MEWSHYEINMQTNFSDIRLDKTDNDSDYYALNLTFSWPTEPCEKNHTVGKDKACQIEQTRKVSHVQAASSALFIKVRQLTSNC